MQALSRITLRLPIEVKQWLAARADLNAGSLNSEIVRLLREKMDHEDRPARAT